LTFGEGGWRVSWFIFGGTTLALAALAFLALRDRPGDMGLNPLGAAEDPSPPNPPGGNTQWGQVYRSPAVWHLGLVYVAFGFSYIIYMTFFAKRLIAEGGYTPAAAGDLFMVIGWLSLFSGLIWGVLSDRIGRKSALIGVYLIQVVAYSLFSLWPAPAGFTLSAILFGLTAWAVPAIMAAISGDVLGPKLAPAALGFVTLFMGIGQAIGPSVAGAMADSTGTFASAFLLAGIVALLGAAATSMLDAASTVQKTVVAA